MSSSLSAKIDYSSINIDRIQNEQWIIRIFAKHSIVIHSGQAAANLIFKSKLVSITYEMWSNNYAMQKQWNHIIHSSDLETPAYSKSERVKM